MALVSRSAGMGVLVLSAVAAVFGCGCELVVGIPDVTLNGTSGGGGGFLEGAATYPTSQGMPTAIAAADVNRDGNPDVITLDAPGALDVRLGSKDGTLGELVTTQVGGSFPLMAIGDFDGDTHVDVALVVTGSTTIQIWRGDGTGAFAKGTSFDEGFAPVALDAADFDGDGDVDLVVMGATKNVVVYSADPASIYSFDSPNGTTQSSVAIGDVNADHRPDLFIVQPDAFSIEVVRGMEGRTFASPVLSSAGDPGQNPNVLNLVSAGDIDGDGLDDVAISTTYYVIYPCYCHADGTCTPVDGTQTAPSSSIRLVDIDGDHHADIVVSHGIGIESIGVRLYQAAGPMFADEVVYAVGTTPGPLTTADLDHDGRPDLIVANQDSQSVSIVYETKPTVHNPLEIFDNSTFWVGRPVVADVDGDGHLDVLFAAFGSNFFTYILGNGDGTFREAVNATHLSDNDEVDAVTAVDLDGDGVLDVVAAGKGTLDVYPGTKGGVFDVPVQSTSGSSQQATDIAAGDLDHDGKVDIAVVCVDDSAVYVFYGNGSTMPMNAMALSVDADLTARSAAIGDVNGDGLDDLVVTSENHNGVIVFLQTSAHTLSMQPPQTLLMGARTMALTDLDGDHKLDLAVAGVGGLDTATNDGTGHFTVTQKLVSTGAVDDVIAVDLTNDGTPELVTASLSTLLLAAYPNLGSSFGAAQSYTAGAMVATAFVGSGDFDGDGRIDVVLDSQESGVVRIRNVSR